MIPADFVEFGKGLGIGAGVPAPVGPMSVLCMRRTLAGGRRFGFGTGAGIAAGDGVYALVAALGLAGVMQFMAAYERPLHLGAGVFLVYLGLRTFFDSPGEAPRSAAPAHSVAGAFGSALLLTLTNPPTIVAFFAIFTAIVPSGFDAFGAAALVSGVFAGSLLWWLVLTSVIALFRRALGSRARCWIDRISGAILTTFGAAEIRRAP